MQEVLREAREFSSEKSACKIKEHKVRPPLPAAGNDAEVTGSTDE